MRKNTTQAETTVESKPLPSASNVLMRQMRALEDQVQCYRQGCEKLEKERAKLQSIIGRDKRMEQAIQDMQSDVGTISGAIIELGNDVLRHNARKPWYRRWI